jgi:hypothetical protein
MTHETQNPKPPANTLHVNRWTDLPDTVAPAKYLASHNGAETLFTASKKMRQVLEALRQRPLACASRCRLSHYVSLLRRDCGIEIEMEMFRGDPHNSQGGQAFGIYRLQSTVILVGESEAA